MNKSVLIEQRAALAAADREFKSSRAHDAFLRDAKDLHHAASVPLRALGRPVPLPTLTAGVGEQYSFADAHSWGDAALAAADAALQLPDAAIAAADPSAVARMAVPRVGEWQAEIAALRAENTQLKADLAEANARADSVADAAGELADLRVTVETVTAARDAAVAAAAKWEFEAKSVDARLAARIAAAGIAPAGDAAGNPEPAKPEGLRGRALVIAGFRAAGMR